MKSFLSFLDDIHYYNLNCVIKHIDELQHLYSCANGCGAENGLDVPDTMWGVDVTSACNIHDIEWQVATCRMDIYNANDNFVHNLKLICDRESNWFTKFLRRMRIAKYSYAVDTFGTENYIMLRGFDEK